jgi:hypothetical protein
MTTMRPLQPFRDYRGHALPMGTRCRRASRDDHARSSREEESADVRFVRELRDLFRGLVGASDVKAIVIRGAGGNFCSGGDVTRSSGR